MSPPRMDDLRTASEQAVDDGDVETALRIVAGLDVWWIIANSLREGRRRFDRLLPAAEGVDPGVLGRALSQYGRVLSLFGETGIAVEVLERSQTLLSGSQGCTRTGLRYAPPRGGPMAFWRAGCGP